MTEFCDMIMDGMGNDEDSIYFPGSRDETHFINYIVYFTYIF